LALVPGDLLVCEGGDIGRTAIWEGQLPLVLYQNHLHRLRPARAGVDPLFYMYWMQAAWLLLGLYGGAGNKTTIPNLSRSRLAAFPVPLPPLPEQRAIAYVLRTVQRAKEATERVVGALKELKKSLMQHLFTYGPVPVDQADQVPLKETEIGPVPEEWRVVRLGEIARVKYGKAKPIDEHGNIPVIGSGGIYGWTAEAAVGFATLIIGRKGTAGQVWLSETPSWPSDTTFYLEWKSRTTVDVRFIYGWFLLNPLSGAHAKTTIPSLQRPDLENSLVPLPPLYEQREIARILQAVEAKITAEQARRAALEALFKTLLHLLMTAKLRVPYEGTRHA
jgi:type I restriction enzyme S subunit